MRGSEDTLELTRAQQDTLRWMRDAFDAVTVTRVLPDGRAWIVAHRDDTITHVDLSRDGIPL